MVSTLMGGAAEAARGVAGKFTKQDVISLMVVLATIACLGVWVGWVAGGMEHRIAELENFKNTGSRCTGERCSAMEAQLTELKVNLKSQDKKLDALIREVTRLTVWAGAGNGVRLHESPNDWMLPGEIVGSE